MNFQSDGKCDDNARDSAFDENMNATDATRWVNACQIPTDEYCPLLVVTA